MELGWKIETGIYADYYLGNAKGLSLDDNKICLLLLERFSKFANNCMPAKNALHQILKEICNENNCLMPKDRADRIEENANAALGYGAIGYLLLDDSLEEIAMSRIGDNIRVYKRGIGWMDTNAKITSRDYAIELVNKLARNSGRRISQANPMINAQVDGGSRMHASFSQIDDGQVEITIRKFPKTALGLKELEQNGMISFEAADFLRKIAKTDASILFCGNTGSGKTTLLNAFFSHVPERERVIAIEETLEIRIPHLHSIKLVANEGNGLSMKELTENTLRMRPDRLIIGEARTENELKALFLSLQAGQARGCYATFHAKSSLEAINRIQSMGILKQDLESLDLVVVCKRIPALIDGKLFEKRRVLEICEINFGVALKLFEFDEKCGKLELNQKNYNKSKIRLKIENLFGKEKQETNPIVNSSYSFK